MRRFSFIFAFAIGMLFCSLAANAQNTFTCNGLTIVVESRDHIKLSVEGHRFVAKEKFDLEVYSFDSSMEGYSSASMREVGDPDFYVSDNCMECATLKAKEARQFVRSLALARADVKLKLDIDLGKDHDDDNTMLFLIPRDVKMQIVNLYRSMR